MNTTSENNEVDGRSRRARERRERRRAQLLQVASEVFGRRGYRSTSVNDVIEAAVSRGGTFYQYFEGLDAVFHTLIDDFVATLIAQVEPVNVEGPDPIGAMRENLTRVVRVLHAHPNEATLLFREAIGADDTVDAASPSSTRSCTRWWSARSPGARPRLRARRSPARTSSPARSSGPCARCSSRRSSRSDCRSRIPMMMAQAIFELGYRGLAVG